MCLATMINSQNLTSDRQSASTSTIHSASLSASLTSRKTFRCHLDFIKLSKNNPPFRPDGRKCERGSVTALGNTVNLPALKKSDFFQNRFLTDPASGFSQLETIGIEPTTSALQGQRSPS